VDQPEEAVARQLDQTADQRQEPGPFHGDGKELLQVLDLTLLLGWELEDRSVQREMETRNVIGFISGIDVELDEEAIIVMAHYDGLGRASGPS